MVEKPTKEGYYKFRVGKDWFIARYEWGNNHMTAFGVPRADGATSFYFDEIDEMVGPIDPRPDSPQPAPDEVEALAEKMFISCFANDLPDPPEPEVIFENAEAFIEFRNARRKESAPKNPPQHIEIEFYLGMGARQIHEYKQLRDILGVHRSAGMFDVLMRLASPGYIENNLLKYFKPNEEARK